MPKTEPASVPVTPHVSATSDWLARQSERRMVLVVLLFGMLLYLPFAGSYGLWDPWETHYGEVGRQMIERADFISLYWPGSPLDQEFFWSKPVLTFWLIALSMAVFGLRGAAPGELATSNVTEWALRVPFCLTALTGLVGVYLIAGRLAGRRAGLFSVIVLGTLPMFSLIARQAMTDMPFVGPMTLALAFALLALYDDDREILPQRQWKRLFWPHHPLFYAVVGVFTLTALPQLVVNSIQLVWRLRIGEHHLALPGVLVMLPYIGGFVFFLVQAARARRRAPLYFYLAGILAALAILAKGIAGLGLPVIVLALHLTATGGWRRLVRPALGPTVWAAILACAVVAVPWHHAMLVRHGFPFWNELYGDNHWRRMVAGRHGDRGTFEYFLREAGYAALPWLVFVPAALSWALGQARAALVPTDPTGLTDPAPTSASIEDRRRTVFWFGTLWFVSAYAVVSLSMTKFHHYLLPALPGLALALGAFLDDLFDQPARTWARLVPLAGVPLLVLVMIDLVRSPKDAQIFIWLFAYDYVNQPGGRPWPPALDYTVPLYTFGTVFAFAGLSLFPVRLRRFAIGLTVLGALSFNYFLLNVYMKGVSDIWSQKDLIASYYNLRASPNERLVAWQMYWRGETFYTQNEIYEGPQDERTVFLGNKNAEDLQAYLGRNHGKRVFFVVERSRLEHLKRLLPPRGRASFVIVNDRNNKFLLARAEL